MALRYPRPAPQPTPWRRLPYACPVCDDGGTLARKPIRPPQCRNGHGPLWEVTDLWRRQDVSPPPAFAEAPDGARVTLVGMLIGVVTHATRQRTTYATAALIVDGGGMVDVEVPPLPYQAAEPLLGNGSRVRVAGIVDRRPLLPLLSARDIEAANA